MHARALVKGHHRWYSVRNNKQVSDHARRPTAPPPMRLRSAAPEGLAGAGGSRGRPAAPVAEPGCSHREAARAWRGPQGLSHNQSLHLCTLQCLPLTGTSCPVGCSLVGPRERLARERAGLRRAGRRGLLRRRPARERESGGIGRVALHAPAAAVLDDAAGDARPAPGDRRPRRGRRRPARRAA